VDISLVTQTTDKSGSSASAVLPVGSASFGPSFANSSETVGTQTLEFTVYPKPYPEPDKNQVPSDWRKIPQNAPLAASLAQLREGLLDASEHDPCVTLVPDGDDAVKAAGGTSEFGFAVTNTKTAGATLQLVIFSLGTTRDRERHFGNTIKVHFKALKGDALYFTNKTLFLTK
jgi:hypothetical protein